MLPGTELVLSMHVPSYTLGVALLWAATALLAWLTALAYALWRDPLAGLAGLVGTIAGGLLSSVVPIDLIWFVLPAVGFLVGFVGFRVVTDRPARSPEPSDPRSVGTGLLAVVTILATLLVVDAALFGRPDQLGGPADSWLTILRGAAILGVGQITVSCFVLYRTVLSGLVSTIRGSPASTGVEQPRK